MFKYIYVSFPLFFLGCGEDQASNLPEGSACSTSSECAGDNACVEAVCADAYTNDYNFKVEQLIIKRLDHWDAHTFKVRMWMTYADTTNDSPDCEATVAARLSQRGEYAAENFSTYTRGTLGGCNFETLKRGDYLNIQVQALAFFDWKIFQCSMELKASILKDEELTCLGGDEGSVKLSIKPK